MDKSIIIKLTKTFEDYAHKEEGVEFWFARDLQKLLGYIEWRKFQGVIEKAKDACKNSNNDIEDHFVGAAKTIVMPKEASGLLSKSGIKPEELPPEEDLVQLQKKVKSEDRKIADNSKRKAQKKLLS